MKLQRLGILAGIALTATVALAACGTDNNNSPSSGGSAGGSASGSAINCATGTLNAQGSTAQANAIATWIKDYNSKCSGATINYQGTGSGAGQQAFIAGQADFAGSDSALKPADQPKANAHCASGTAGGVAIHLPMVVGPIAVVYNVSGVTNLQLKPATIAGIFSGKITTWNDPTIAADNPGASLPSTKITPVHRAESSGTSDNFTNYLSQTAGSAWTFGHDKVWHAPGGDAEQGSDGVSKFISSTDGSIGYDEWSFATLNNLNMAKIFNGNGEWSTLTADSAGKTIAGAQVVGTGNDLQMKIDYTTKTPGAYPIVLVTYEIVCDK
ncbi:MAG TPA: phosphate ABC transporter substrate-binding protein PstS, partial [Micromonosporaceae bacterium]|nr:phosphate ABC transporter substrate-binding protein PstS [Micromonosporaceae bacterium]